MYMYRNTVNPYYRTAWRMFMKLDRDEVPMAQHMHSGVSARSTQGWIQGRVKIGHGGPFLQETSSADQKATATNPMYNNDLETCGMSCCFFFVPFWSKSIFYAFIVLRWETVALWASCLLLTRSGSIYTQL